MHFMKMRRLRAQWVGAKDVTERALRYFHECPENHIAAMAVRMALESESKAHEEMLRYAGFPVLR